MSQARECVTCAGWRGDGCIAVERIALPDGTYLVPSAKAVCQLHVTREEDRYGLALFAEAREMGGVVGEFFAARAFYEGRLLISQIAAVAAAQP